MTPVLLDIPDDPQLWPKWLEEKIVGLRLGELVDQLQLVVPDTEEPQPAIDELFGAQLEKVLQTGLSVLSHAQLSAILKSPELLLSLQEQVFLEGGSYWESVSKTEVDEELVKSHTPQIETLLSEIPSSRLEYQENTSQSQKRFSSRIVFRILSTVAAMVSIGMTLWLIRPQAPSPTGWGFNRPGALAVQLPAGEYLDHLADSAQEWFKKPVHTKETLATRLAQFSAGCQKLIEAEHPQLSKADRDWLAERCGVWKGKIDTQLAQLNTGVKTVDEVRSEANATVNKLIDSLRNRVVAA